MGLSTRGKVYAHALSTLNGIPIGDVDFWVEKGKIPLGTVKPYSSYGGPENIPMKDIVTIDFDPVDTPSTERKAMNVLNLAGSGDGKTLMGKNVWAVLHAAKYYCCYIDPKSTDSGRAKMPWESKRLAPHVVPRGIALAHYMPIWAIRKEFKHLEHNFIKFSTRLHKLTEPEMWRGLGMTSIGANNVAIIIRRYIEEEMPLTIRRLCTEIKELELNSGTENAILDRISEVEAFGIVNSRVGELDLLQEWEKGNSVCISYNSCSPTFMSFDVGQKINEAANLYHAGNRIPIMFFLDDSKYYSKRIQGSNFNFAVDEIANIGFNYRSLGVFNWMNVQSLAIIDEAIAESYRIKIISPLFYNTDSLASIGIPKVALKMLKENKLIKDKKNHLMQFLLITEDNEVVPFFPFTPPCGHFEEVYFERGVAT